ncbi:MAG: putative Ig domain-containing protein [Acidobacteria bacterium]|nr:putative Ig domain-containing protein [Acidobacteriota bacterium]
MKNAPLKAILPVMALAVLAAPALAQTGPVQPVITSVQSSFVCECAALDVQAVTIGTPGDILIFLNGTFDLGFQPSLYWTDPINNTPVPLSVNYFYSNVVVAYVPMANFAAALGTNPRTVQIRVQQGNLSATTNFGLNAPMQLVSPLPVGTTGTSYLAPVITGGTAPFTLNSVTGSVPPGLGVLQYPVGTTAAPYYLVGTPTTAGIYSFTPTLTDIWGNVAPVSGQPNQSEYIQVVAPAVVSQVAPNSIPAGSGYYPITVTGANFTSGSLISWTVNDVETFLANTSYVSPTQLTAYVPTSKLASPATVSVGVLQPNNINYGSQTLTIAPPTLSNLSPPTVNMGAAFTLTLTGTNFASRIGAPDVNTGPYVPTVYLGASALPATLVNASTLTVAIPGNLVAAPGPIPVRVVNPGGSTTGTINLTVNSTLAISTSALPNGTVGTPYTFRLTATGGGSSSPYSWNISGLPLGLFANPQTGDITGTPQTPGTVTVTVKVTDSYATTVQTTFPLTIVRPAPVITTPSNLPDGTVGIFYAVNLDTSNANGPITYSLGSGQLPDGLQIASSGRIDGLPLRAGTFSFGVNVTLQAGDIISKIFTIVIHPSPLTLADSSTTVTAGTPVTITLSATGGVQPYKFTLTCSLPDGLSYSVVTISGTPTTPGTTTCVAGVTDSANTSTSRPFTITVVAQALSFTGAALPDGKVGVVYSAKIAALGGTPPLKYSGSGLPDGLSLDPGGAITGTPNTAGQFTLSATATDSAVPPATATARFTIKIVPADLVITTKSLPDGVVGAAYSASITASGGVRPYTFNITGLPGGVTGDSTGAITGAPNAVGTFTVSASVKDSTGATATASYTVKVAAAALTITTASLPNGTVGVSYSAGLNATGGVTPLTWSASGLPGGLSISSSGAITGSPNAPGTFNVSATVKDAGGTSVSKSYTVTISLPSTPTFNIGGGGGSANPLQQPQVTVSLGSAFPVDIVVTLTLTFAPGTGPDDPAIQFSSGGRTVQITIPAGSTTGSTSVSVQTGTVAGVITITSRLQAAGADVTPSPAPTQTIRIAGSVPVITQVTGARTSTGFTVTVTGYAPTRRITQAIFQFTAANGTTLGTTSITVPVDTLFTPYFSTTTAGSQFIYTQPFTVSGNLQGITSVSVTLVGDTGNSTPATATVN